MSDQLLTAVIAIASAVIINASGAALTAFFGRRKTSAEVKEKDASVTETTTKAAAQMVDKLREEVERSDVARDKLQERVSELEAALAQERDARERVQLEMAQLRSDCERDKRHMQAQLSLLIHQLRNRGDEPLIGSGANSAPG